MGCKDAAMTDSEMADALKAKGWTVAEPWTKENCKHPPHMKIGSGSAGCDGSSSGSWHCRACGKSEKWSTPADPKRVQQMAQGFY